MEPTGVGTDVVSVLKSVKSLSEAAIEDFTKYRTERNPAYVAHASACLREINEFLGEGKLGLMITILDGMSREK